MPSPFTGAETLSDFTEPPIITVLSARIPPTAVSTQLLSLTSAAAMPIFPPAVILPPLISSTAPAAETAVPPAELKLFSEPSAQLMVRFPPSAARAAAAELMFTPLRMRFAETPERIAMLWEVTLTSAEFAMVSCLSVRTVSTPLSTG